MSFVVLATQRFDEMASFYGETLGFSRVRDWDRPNGRGVLFDLHGLRLELLDATREPRPMNLEPPSDRVHVVVEVPDLEAARTTVGVATPEPFDTTWGARAFQIRDPDGFAVWYLQWITGSAGSA